MEWVILVAGILGKFLHEPVRLPSTILIEFKFHTLHWSIFILYTQFTLLLEFQVYNIDI